MKVKPIGSNMTEVNLKNVRILFSYETPVACYWETKIFEGNRFKVTDHKWSTTTSRHINKWLFQNGIDRADAEPQPQSYFYNLS